MSYAGSQHIELNAALLARSAPVGWDAIACDAISEVPHKKGIYELNGLVGDVRLKVFVQMSGLQLRAPYFVRILDGDRYIISTFQLRDGSLNDFEFPGFKFLSQIAPLMVSASRKSYGSAKQRRVRAGKQFRPPESLSSKIEPKRAETKSGSLNDESLAVLKAFKNAILKKS